MRRSLRGNSETAASLFPFLAVLLCTMGAMVVLLVAMAHVSREKAELQAEMQAATVEAAETPEQQLARERLAEAKAYRDNLKDARKLVASQLNEEKTKLTGIEDHIRRLQDEVRSLHVEQMVLDARKEEHYDDQAMAEIELDRLRAFEKVRAKDIAELKKKATERKRRYAIVPMRNDATGTNRPTIYFECRADGIVLQPEGIQLASEDFLPPVEHFSPFAAALRTVKQYYLDHPEARAVGEEGEPYPLLVVRPDGILNHHAAQKVLLSLDEEFGYQPVAEEWPLEYGPPNPLLAEQVASAIDLARFERKRLAKIAPHLFRRDNQFAFDIVHGQKSALRTRGSSRGRGRSDNPFSDVRINGPASVIQDDISSLGYQGEKQGEYLGQTGSLEADFASSGGGAEDDTRMEQSSMQVNASDTPEGSSEQGATGGNSHSSSSAMASPEENAPTNTLATTGVGQGKGNSTVGEDPRRGISMRRVIHLAIYGDRVIVLADGTLTNRAESIEELNATSAYGEMIELTGSTPTHIQQVVLALKKHAKSWGTAGSGFYWKPTLVLNVAPNGVSRANELADMLRSAGIDVFQQPALSVAAKEGDADAPVRR